MENDIKLKDYIDKCLESSTNELFEHQDDNDSSTKEVISKYHKMLVNIKKICINRNRF